MRLTYETMIKMLTRIVTDYAFLSNVYREDAGGLIKGLRNERGLSLRELAAELDMSCTMLCLIENGRALPTIKLLAKIVELITPDLTSDK